MPDKTFTVRWMGETKEYTVRDYVHERLLHHDGGRLEYLGDRLHELDERVNRLLQILLNRGDEELVREVLQVIEDVEDEDDWLDEDDDEA